MPHYKWITVGSDTCFACTRWNNIVFRNLSEVPDLPVHPNCRCRVQVIQSPQEKAFVKIGAELSNLKLLLSNDLHDLSNLIFIPFLFERLVHAAQDL